MSGSWVLFLLILISSIPIIAVYIWFRLAKHQISIVRFLFALLAGAAAFFPALILQNLLSFSFPAQGRLAMFFEVFVRIAFTEELSRLLMLFVFFKISSRIASGRTPFRGTAADLHSEGPDTPNQPLSFNVIKMGTAIGLVAGLGFAIIESAVYGASNTNVLLLRAVTAAPLHAACGSRIGAAAVMFRTSPFQALFRLFAAAAIHGIYNFMAAMPGFPSILAILITLSALMTSILIIRGAQEPQYK